VDLTKRVEILERRLKLLAVALMASLAGLVTVSLHAQAGNAERLRVRQITVVDDKGVERLIIGAPVPDPIVQGVRRRRSGPISGIVWYDTKGNERAGFATSDTTPSEVFIGLDSERGQEARLLVNPGGGGHLTFFDAEQNYARLGISQGRPIVIVRDKSGTIFEQPAVR
jgi:hypothetical protein